MNNDKNAATDYQTVSGKILPTYYKDGLQITPTLSDVIDDVKNIRWRWSKEGLTKTILGFAIDINPNLRNVEYIEEAITKIIAEAFVTNNKEIHSNILNLYFGGLKITIMSGACDGYPITASVDLDIPTLFAPPPDYSCRARQEYFDNP